MLEELLIWEPTYSSLFVLCISMGLIGFVPEDVVVMVAGMKVDQGHIEWMPTLAVACVGILIRDVLAYALGRSFGDWLLSRPLVSNLVGQTKIDRSRRMFEERGAQAVMLGRFMVGMRVPVFVIAGTLRVSRRRFVLWDAIGIVLTVPVELYLGLKFGGPMIETAQRVLSRTSTSFGIMGLVALVAFFWFRSKKKEPKSVTSESQSTS